MTEHVPFSQILELFEKHGWRLMRIEGEYRLFEKPGSEELPYPVPVQDKKVERYYVDKIRQYLGEDE
jgi:hypothetical protein